MIAIRVIDTDAQSHVQCSRSVDAVLASAEREKKRKYSGAAMAHHAFFSPLVSSVDGQMGQEARVFMKQVVEKLAIKWQRSYSEVMGWVQTRMSFAILKSTNRCIRGPRVNGEAGLAWMMVLDWPSSSNRLANHSS